MSAAWIGGPTEEWRHFLCCYSDAPGELKCQRDATWHGIVIDDGNGELVAMKSCDEHKPIMEWLCDYVHQLVHPCGVPGSMFRWPENECYTDWDEAAEFAAESTAVSSP